MRSKKGSTRSKERRLLPRACTTCHVHLMATGTGTGQEVSWKSIQGMQRSFHLFCASNLHTTRKRRRCSERRRMINVEGGRGDHGGIILCWPGNTAYYINVLLTSQVAALSNCQLVSDVKYLHTCIVCMCVCIYVTYARALKLKILRPLDIC